jgi:hypothetical protein
MKKILKQKMVSFALAKLKVISVLTLITGFSMAACISMEPDVGYEGDLNKTTWVASDGSTLTFGKEEFTMTTNKVAALKGTYTPGDFNYTITQVNYGHPDMAVKELEKRWYTKAEMQKLGYQNAQLNQLFLSQKLRFQSGNQLTFRFANVNYAFTKK